MPRTEFRAPDWIQRSPRLISTGVRVVDVPRSPILIVTVADRSVCPRALLNAETRNGQAAGGWVKVNVSAEVLISTWPELKTAALIHSVSGPRALGVSV